MRTIRNRGFRYNLGDIEIGIRKLIKTEVFISLQYKSAVSGRCGKSAQRSR